MSEDRAKQELEELAKALREAAERFPHSKSYFAKSKKLALMGPDGKTLPRHFSPRNADRNYRLYCDVHNPDLIKRYLCPRTDIVIDEGE